MNQRKTEMTRHSDPFIVLPGGYGTLEELLEVIAWAQLGIHKKIVSWLTKCRWILQLSFEFHRKKQWMMVSSNQYKEISSFQLLILKNWFKKLSVKDNRTFLDSSSTVQCNAAQHINVKAEIAYMKILGNLAWDTQWL